MRNQVLATLGVCLIVGLGQQASAHVGRDVQIFELATEDLPDLRDGSMQDWEDVLGDNFLTMDFFETLDDGGHGGAPKDPADMDYKVYLAWNSRDQRIYVGVDRTDNIYLNSVNPDDPFDAWQWDGIEVYLDGDHSGGQFNLFSADDVGDQVQSLQNRQAQQWLILPESTGPQTAACFCFDKIWARGAPWTDAGGMSEGSAPVRTVTEAALTAWDDMDSEGPETSVRSSLIGGKTIGFSLTINDFDEAPAAYHATHTFTSVGDGYYQAGSLADAELVPCAGGDCGSAPTAVASDSWGRIKASFSD
ncbi:MAG: hypothetical protein HN712_22265 [Gemmatimonadetes bacterium]|jgi:hypothetical protein|nr:hypothetical protein [Gemmatimonadota bacterium]MBT7863055.1 hypothetical protein [Gemmatimonadota bacterium]